VRFRRRTLNRLKFLLALVVIAGLVGGVLLWLAVPQTAILVAAVGASVAIASYFLHRDAAVMFASILLYPILALGIYALHAVLGVPTQYLLWVSLGVFGFVVLVLTADEIPM
jgi:hypothetical protein